ncbi:MAG: alpha/beta hydrolase [Spirochaetia bacterium]
MSARARTGVILKIVLIPLGALCVIGAGLLLWISASPALMPEAFAALRGSPEVTVSVGKWGVFEPAAGKPRVGLIIYPASRVDWRAYAPPALAIAREGFLVVLVPMPLNLAALDPVRATSVMAAFTSIRAWVLAGHGEGGAMAARFAMHHPRDVRALILWAARPGPGDNLGAARIPVLSISAERDGLVPPLVIRESAWLLPSSTRWVTIPGGNHSQFGWYGNQDRDGKALISREQQQARVVRATLQLLRSIAK